MSQFGTTRWRVNLRDLVSFDVLGEGVLSAVFHVWTEVVLMQYEEMVDKIKSHPSSIEMKKIGKINIMNNT